MKEEVFAEFSCYMAAAKITRIRIKESTSEYYLVTTWTRIKDDALASNLNVSQFICEHDAKQSFSNFVHGWI